MNSNIFERHELKYLIDSGQRRRLENAMRGQMQPDVYGESTICSVYFDTADFRLIRRSLEKPVYKEKLRLRSYGPVTADQKVFLELKKKYKGIVYKRRILLEEQEAMQFLLGRAEMKEHGQIGREIAYFTRFYGELKPAVFICCDRTAFAGTQQPDLRITFDKNIRWRTDHLRLTASPFGRQILPAGYSLMEIKTPAAIPLWLTSFLTKEHIMQTSFSKYGRAYQSMLRGEKSDEQRIGGVFCA